MALFLILGFTEIASAIAPPATVEEFPEDITARLQQRYDEMDSLKFNFFQDTRGEMTGRARKGSGWAAFHKSGGISRMRWDYSSPDKQVLVSDGNTFSMYFENLQQMIVTPAKNLDADLTYSFFTGKGNLKRDFHIRPPDNDFQSEARSEFRVIKLIPKVAHSQVQDIHLWVTQDSLIRRIKIRDHFGTITVLNLSDIIDNGLKNSSEEQLQTLFSFTPPQGTEIINQ